jgi:biotin carboxyl carrier protein
VIVDVEVNGRPHRVELERSDSRWTATLAGRSVVVDAARAGSGNQWSLLIAPTGAGPTGTPVSFAVSIDYRGTGASTVSVGGRRYAARVIDPRQYSRRGRGPETAGGAERNLASAMAGRIVKVLVAPGDRVTARQGLVVVEAMKMENELRAPADAVVREVRVVEGASVEAGAILVVLE